MRWVIDALNSSIGKKFIMGLLGLALTGFLGAHLGGNLLVLFGEEAFNSYAHHLEVFPLIFQAEVALALVFLLHIITGLWLTAENWGARPQRYAVVADKGEKTVVSGTMIFSGAIIALFLLVHLLNLRFSVDYDKLGPYGATIEVFRNGWYSMFYILCMCVIGAHVWHGFQSALRSLGISHPKYTPGIEWLSRLLGVAFAVGFSSIPIYVLLFLGGQG
jgi:succinate dehydrogenase / fumarate reductase cytochrome b subunit